MSPDPLIIPGVVVEGHRVASGPSREYPYGSLERQLPYFQAGGLDLSRFYFGTLNLLIAPMQFRLVKPAYTFHQVAWTDLHPPEDFSFLPCSVALTHGNIWYDGYIYYPHPETKIRHFHNPSLVEVITVRLPGVGYGSRLLLSVDASAVEVTRI